MKSFRRRVARFRTEKLHDACLSQSRLESLLLYAHMKQGSIIRIFSATDTILQVGLYEWNKSRKSVSGGCAFGSRSNLIWLLKEGSTGLISSLCAFQDMNALDSRPFGAWGVGYSTMIHLPHAGNHRSQSIRSPMITRFYCLVA